MAAPDGFALLVATHLVMLHTVDGREVAINPAQVTSVLAAKEGEDNKLLSNEVRCVIGLTDGKRATVVESCKTVLKLLENAK